ncbi:hypothetical protein [Rhizobium lusitanum]|uniref:Uncharacterized protein n=1 Tax=Rhizobium lusitanum TaxID=293958 RepID=A0A7X0IW64_9HYPH|nr:hypothetical protein [Rhizobium lusitanum]MBB6487888.1 hypothetical protein [Rhizobium lusitanum]
MDMQPVRWWNGQSEVTRRLGTGLAVCGTVVGALYLIVETAPSERAMRLFDDSGRITINSARSLDQGVTNGPQLAIDASPPTRQMMAAAVPIPMPSPFASAKVAAPVKHVALRSDVLKAKPAIATGVERFDRCLPQCESRDPLIAGYPEYAQAEPPLVNQDPPPVVEEKVGFRPLAGARELLNQAVDAPGAMLRRSRQALDNVAHIEW